MRLCPDMSQGPAWEPLLSIPLNSFPLVALKTWNLLTNGGWGLTICLCVSCPRRRGLVTTPCCPRPARP